MAHSPSFVLKITSRRDPRCTRTISFRGDRTLVDVHHAIQREFDLDSDHLWSFYLSGVLHDRDTEFSVSDRAPRQPGVRLDALDLEPGHEFAYLFDFGDELVHDLEVVRVEPAATGDTAAERSLSVPLVLAREGTPPPQYPDDDDDDDDDEEEERPSAPDARSGAKAPAPPPRAEEALAATLSLEAALRAETNLDPSEVLAPIQTIFDAAPDRDGLLRLARYLGEEHSLAVHWAVARTLRDLLSEPTLSVELADLAGRWARLTGEWSDVATWARGLARSGRQERAVAEVSAFEATGPAAIERDTELAELLAGAGRSTESEALLQRLLGKRWLPGRARKRCEALLDGVLRATGRAAEADRRQDEALRRASPGRGTVAFRSAKVAPNDRCPCGSGKKYKRCCAAR